MSTTPPDEPTGTPPGSTPPPPPSGPDYGAPPPSGPDYGAPPPPPGGGYGTPPPPPGGGYGAPPGGAYGAPPPPGGSYGPAGDEWSVGNALSYGWAKFKENLGTILLLTVILLAASVVLSIVGSLLDQAVFGTRDDIAVGQSTRSVFSSLLGFLGQAFFGAVVVRAALDITEGRALEIGSIFQRLNIGAVLVLAILVAIIQTIGFILLVIPGLIAILFLYFATFFLLDQNLSPIDAIKASVNLVRRDLGKAFVWAVVAFLVSIVGVCLCCVGLLATVPIATIGTAYTYKKLTGQPVAA
jgi:hypothetical protein